MSQQVNAKSVTRNVGWSVLSKTSTFGLKFVTVPILARLLTPEEFGAVAVALAVVPLLAMIGGAGLASALILFLVRPVAGWISLAGLPLTNQERGVIAFLGIRGLGSFYYLAYALGQAEFEQPEILWVTVCNLVLVSIVLHGVIVTPVMRRLDQGRSTRPGTKELPPI